jgi:2-keto-4-pentenoate hydratase/2-oxohepta-3-ene-1,7-dioic acid hydratase in catechol pathway
VFADSSAGHEMKICRFDEGRIGIVQDDRVFDVTAVPAEQGMPPPSPTMVPEILPALARLTQTAIELRRSYTLRAVRLRSPIARPGKIVAAPANYRAHVQEMVASGLAHGHKLRIDEAGLFLKASSSVVGPSEGVAIRFPQRRTDHEVELVAVIGRRCTELQVEDALECVAGYCLGLDITLRGPEDRSFRKSIDSYTVIGPWITTSDEITDPNAIELRLKCNGELRQSAVTSDMIYSVRKLLAFASTFYTLEPGDLLFTGTPSGVGPIHPGDELVVEGQGLGRMIVNVRSHGQSIEAV